MSNQERLPFSEEKTDSNKQKNSEDINTQIDTQKDILDTQLEETVKETAETQNKATSHNQKQTKANRSSSKQNRSTTKTNPANNYTNIQNDMQNNLQVNVQDIDLHSAAQNRYIHYAMSVITSRALPDVRDGLKPVQRRIIYAMYHNLHLLPEGRYRKSAAVVGEVMAKYHPHGDSSIYDAMVRMAQTFSLRYPIIDGNGNFGSLDGDPAAAMRYTEAKLRSLAVSLIEEIKYQTVSYRPNYDSTYEEPIVLPAQLPQLLLNGTSGIAVGMATNIPPHNSKEIITACLALIDDPSLTSSDLCRYVKGPDFPVGGILLTTTEELKAIYETGEGAIRVRGEYIIEENNKETLIIIRSLPYSVNKAQLVQTIADLIIQNKIPQVSDIRDESTEDIRVVIEIKKGASIDAVMAYLYKHTSLENTMHVNMTCIVPTIENETPIPRRLSLQEILQFFLEFRMEIVTSRLNYEISQIRKKIHILEGFERIFDELDTAIKIIRDSDGKLDAANKLIARFFLDEIQVDSILETKLYRLAKLEINSIREELQLLRTKEDAIYSLLSDSSLRWSLIKKELADLKLLYQDERRTKTSEYAKTFHFDPDNYSVTEEVIVIVTTDGWIKRQKSFSDISTLRLREGDTAKWIYALNTNDNIAFFTNIGTVYVMKVEDIAATTGYGEPIQRHFQFLDQEKLIGVTHFKKDLFGLAITKMGKGVRFPMDLHKDTTTKLGRKYIRIEELPIEDSVISIATCTEDQFVSIITESSRIIVFSVESVNVLKGLGKGIQVIKLQNEDKVLAFGVGNSSDSSLKVQTIFGASEKTHIINAETHKVTERAGKGTELIKRGKIKIIPQSPVIDIHY